LNFFIGIGEDGSPAVDGAFIVSPNFPHKATNAQIRQDIPDQHDIESIFLQYRFSSKKPVLR
jgi:hypothetical protein